MPDAFSQLEDQDIDSRVVLDYTSRDFTAIRSQLVGLAKGLMPEWQTAGEPSDFGTLLMEIFAYMGDVMHFYIDRTASEAFLGSAIRQQSVLYIANMLGYTPIGQQSATVTLLFRLDENATEDVIIPKGTRLHNSANNADDLIIFETDMEIKLPWTDSAGVTWREITGYATEGVMVYDRLLGICLGQPMTEFIIPDIGVVYGSISVTSREGFQVVEWTHVSNLSLARPTQPVFTTYRDEADYTHIIFGDNAAGRIPPVNAELFVTYRYGVGAEANLLAVGSVNTIVNTTGDDWWGLTVTNPFSPVGGTDPESVDAMRQSIPRAAGRIKNRAITLHDYADLALQVPGVAKSVSYGTVYTAVRVKIAPTAGEGDDAYLQKLCRDVEEYMLDKVIIGSKVYAEPDTMEELWQNVYIRLLVHVQKGYNRTTVKNTVDQTIRQVLHFDSVDFGTRVSIGQIYRTALAVQGVEWAELAWLSTIAPPIGLTQSSDIALFEDSWLFATGTAGPALAKHFIQEHPTAPTRLFFSTTSGADNPWLAELQGLKPGDQILKRPVGDVNSWQTFIVTAVPTLAADSVTVPVSISQWSDIITPSAVDAPVYFDFKRPAIQEVSDIETDELLIPRIAPMAPVKTGNITAVELTGNVAKITLGSPHKMIVGETVDVAGSTDNTFNGRYMLTAVTSNTVSYAKTNIDIVSTPTGGTVSTVNLPESIDDYPELVEEEDRIHDGLWIVADGGLLGT